MNHIRWAAWGVIDIEAFDRMQRRNYIKRTRKELEPLGVVLNCGGSTAQPFYQMKLSTDTKGYGGKDAFRKACAWALQQLGDADERSEDGGVRSAGTEAAVSTAGDLP